MDTYLTIGMIGMEMLPVLHNNTIAAQKVSRKYESQFARTGAKIGSQFGVRKPPRYIAGYGPTFVAQDYQDEQVLLTVDQPGMIGVEFGEIDLTLSMDDFNGRVLAPQLVPLANQVDVFLLNKFAGAWNTTGTPGITAATDTPFVDARAKLVYNSAPMSKPWPMLISPTVSSRLSSGLAGRFNPSDSISELYKMGAMNNSWRSIGMALGWDFFESQNVPLQTTGATAANVPATGITVNGAGQVGATINLQGFTATAAQFAAGDVIQFAGVYLVNPITKQSSGVLQDFLVTAAVTSGGGGTAAVSINPPIITSGKDQTVSASPANSAQVTLYGTAAVASVASQASIQCCGWAEDAITLACVDLQKFEEGEGVKCIRVKDEDLGLSIMWTRGADIREFSRISRVDMLYGGVLTRPEHFVRVASAA
jgi:hypothetical protein